MSKLPKAPLIEIILELRWNITNKTDLSKIQYLHGDIYSELKEKYPYRESVVPPGLPMDILINQPFHRYRSAANDYPLFQVGPGILTLNTIDTKYYWDNFSDCAEELLKSFLKVFPFDIGEKFTPSILYLDFFPFDFDKADVYNYLNQKFKINFGQSFIKNENPPTDVNLGFYYTISDGDLSITFQKGQNNSRNGIILQTRINGVPLEPEVEKIQSWYENSHNTISDLFKKLTAGELYESFK
jgi:uncharacterized protein (TIGR04255 family)